LIGFLVLPRVPFTAEVAIDGKGRSGREAGNIEFRMVMGRAGCREDAIGDARGDETRGRFELIASDMILVVRRGWSRQLWVWWECNVAVRVRGYLEGVMLALGREGKSERRFGASERVLINECMPVASAVASAHFVGVRVL
jgi:hypothetical protein